MTTVSTDRDAQPLDYEIVVSAENNAYLLWQCLLFHASCVEVQGVAPSFVVHSSGPLLAGFRVLAGLGAGVRAAPNYRGGARIDYPPRNTPGSLLEADHDREWTFLCDPDLLILRRLPTRVRALCRADHRLSWEASSYMNAAPFRDWLAGTCRETGIDPARVLTQPSGGSVPHLVHRDLRRSFAASWLEATDALIEVGVRTNDMHWVASMWGFTLAAERLGLPIALTSLAQTSYLGSQTPQSSLRASLLHYCYGDEIFNKHNHCTPETAPRVWQVEAAGTSVSAWLVRRITEARAWYSAVGIDVTSPSLYRD